MKNLSYTQEYFLCALSEQGSIPAMRSTEIITCIVAGGVLELLSGGYVEWGEKDKVSAVKEIDEKVAYLEPLYSVIRDNRPVSVKRNAEKYIFSTKRRINDLILAIGASLEGECLSVQKIEGLLYKRTLFIPNKEQVVNIIQKIKTNFIAEGETSEDIVVLATLLARSGLAQKYFSEAEGEAFHKRLEEVKKSDLSALVKKMLDHIETMVAVVAVAGATGV